MGLTGPSGPLNREEWPVGDAVDGGALAEIIPAPEGDSAMSTADLPAPDWPDVHRPPADLPADPHGDEAGPTCPLSLSVAPIAGLLNGELTDDPVYDGFELQWFDDPVHGTGMLAFLSRRVDRRVDYYRQPTLRLEQSSYQIGGGTGAWVEADFEVARLQVAEDGVDAAVRFTDVDGRPVEIIVNDRDGAPRRPAGLLAPVGADIQQPAALLLVWMPRFDLVRATGTKPVIRIGGRDVATGRLPGAWLHRRHLIKYAAPLCAVEVNRGHDGPLSMPGPPQRVERAADGSGIVALTTEQGEHRARMVLEPGFPDVDGLADGAVATGVWHVHIDDARVTGGRWHARRRGDEVDLGLDVVERWRPGPLPPLMRVVTTVVPVFRRWPTSYRWRAVVRLAAPPSMCSGWQRMPSGGGRSYRRATGS